MNAIKVFNLQRNEACKILRTLKNAKIKQSKTLQVLAVDMFISTGAS